MSNKKSKRKETVARKRTGKWIAVAVLLAAGLFIGGKWFIAQRASESAAVVVPELSPESLTGAAAFRVHCVACHGENGAGTDKGPPLVNDIYRPSHHADYSFVRAASLGVRQHHWAFGDMPRLPQVTRQEVERIIAYVRELQRANGIY